MPNGLKQQFSAERPSEKWLVGVTDIPTREGWLCVAVALDVHSRRIVGRTMGSCLVQGLVLQALQIALRHRHPSSDLLHHSDEVHQQLLEAYGITVSTCGAGNSHDKARMESFFNILRAECVTGSDDTRPASGRRICEDIEV